MKNITEIKKSMNTDICKFILGCLAIFESLMQLTHTNSIFTPYLLLYLLGFVAYIYIYIAEIGEGLPAVINAGLSDL